MIKTYNKTARHTVITKRYRHMDMLKFEGNKFLKLNKTNKIKLKCQKSWHEFC